MQASYSINKSIIRYNTKRDNIYSDWFCFFYIGLEIVEKSNLILDETYILEPYKKEIGKFFFKQSIWGNNLRQFDFEREGKTVEANFARIRFGTYPTKKLFLPITKGFVSFPFQIINDSLIVDVKKTIKKNE